MMPVGPVSEPLDLVRLSLDENRVRQAAWRSRIEGQTPMYVGKGLETTKFLTATGIR